MSDRMPPPLPPPRRDIVLALSLALVGSVLLPGICALVFFSSDPKGMLTDSLGLTLLITCLAVSAGGMAMIWAAVRRPRR